MTRNAVLIPALILLTGCNISSSSAETFTLYRNSFIQTSLRIHFATFDAAESDRNYNRNNCEMVARLLNANVDASAEEEGKPRDASLGFWCEPGNFSETGDVPTSFPGAFPTDV